MRHRIMFNSATLHSDSSTVLHYDESMHFREIRVSERVDLRYCPQRRIAARRGPARQTQPYSTLRRRERNVRREAVRATESVQPHRIFVLSPHQGGAVVPQYRETAQDGLRLAGTGRIHRTALVRVVRDGILHLPMEPQSDHCRNVGGGETLRSRTRL